MSVRYVDEEDETVAPRHRPHRPKEHRMTALSTTSTLEGLTPGTWTVDPSHSEVGFVVRHLMVSKVKGRFGRLPGWAGLASEQPAGHAGRNGLVPVAA